MNSFKGLFPDDTNTLIGLIVALSPTILSWFGYAPTPQFNAEFPNAVMAVITVVGAIYTAYGKLRHQIPNWVRKV